MDALRSRRTATIPARARLTPPARLTQPAQAVLTLAVAAALLTSCSSSRSTVGASQPTTLASIPATSAGRPPTAPGNPGNQGNQGTTTPAPSGATGTWTTYFHDAARTGQASDGPSAPAAVHRQWTTPALDGDIYAQPLVVGNRVIVATENDTVYALDAATGKTVWHSHVGSPVDSSTLPCGDVTPVVGITSTPVVDPSAKRVYAAALVRPARDLLFALDLDTGSVVSSTAVDAPGADPATNNQRGALSVDHGAVLVPFGGRFGDCGSYHGRLASVPVTASGLGTPTYYTRPSANEGGFWAPPGAVVAPDGSLYLTSGNSSSQSFDYGDSVVHLSPALALLDYFAPANWAALNNSDGDLGSTNPVLIGDQVFQVGKGGVGYLLAANHLGRVGGQVSAAQVCPELAMGGVSHAGNMLFVSCPDALVAVSVAGIRITPAWRASAATPGPAAVTPAAIWVVATRGTDLVALDAATGRRLWSQSIGTVPSRFTSPAVGSGLVLVAAGTTVLAFGNS